MTFLVALSRLLTGELAYVLFECVDLAFESLEPLADVAGHSCPNGDAVLRAEQGHGVVRLLR